MLRLLACIPALAAVLLTAPRPAAPDTPSDTPSDTASARPGDTSKVTTSARPGDTSGARPGDTSKAAKDPPLSPKQATPGKHKLCCGYPLSAELGFALRFYWLAMETSFSDALLDGEPMQDIYTREGFYFGTFPESFVDALRMEGSGLLADGRVVNFDGRCKFGVGTCFEQLDPATHPYGRGARRRPLEPFRSVAVDPKVIDIGEPLYVPELDGVLLPDGTFHDGCVRADDTGSAIKRRKIDFFVMSFENFRFLLAALWGVEAITPHVESPRCAYLRAE